MCRRLIQIIIIIITQIGYCYADSALYQSIEPIHILARVRGEGTVKIKLTKLRLFETNTESRFYQGVIQRRDGEYPVSADKIHNTLRVVFPGKIKGSRKSRQRTYKLMFTHSRVPHVSSVPSSFIKHKDCDTKGDLKKEIVYSLAAPTNLVSTKVLTINTFFDAEWESIYGTLSNHEIVSIINTAEALYEQQLGIRFRITSQNKLQSQPANLSAGTILSNFQRSGETTPADVQHLFTGKDIEGSTVGIAYIGAVCYSPDYAFGVTQSYGILTSNIFAHELGHNLGAPHDSTWGSIMYPSISYGTPYFSAKSVSDITGFLSYFGSCLENENLPPSLHGAKLTMRRSGKYVNIKLLSRTSIGIQNVPVVVTTNGITRIRYTDVTGTIRVALPKTKGKRVRITALVQEDSSITKTIVIRI